MSITILVAEDSVTMRRVIEMCFTGESARVISYGTAEEVLKHAAADRPNIVIADSTLPGMNGYSLAAALEEQPTSRGVPVILLTSAEQTYDAVRGAAVGILNHLQKPFESAALLQAVAEAVHASEASTVKLPSTKDDDFATLGEPVEARSSNAAPPPLPPAQDAPPAVKTEPAVDSDPRETAQEVASAPKPPAFPANPPTLPVGPAGAVEMLASLLPPSQSIAVTSSMYSRMSELGLSDQQLTAVVAVAREAVEQVVWEVVPELAETIIREEIARLTAE